MNELRWTVVGMLKEIILRMDCRTFRLYKSIVVMRRSQCYVRRSREIAHRGHENQVYGRSDMYHNGTGSTSGPRLNTLYYSNTW